MISNNLQHLTDNIRAAAKRSGRSGDNIILVGVTKFASVQAVNEALRAGLSHIAENRVQLADEKFPLLDAGGRLLTTHLIGHLQTNKVRDAVRLFDLIQSVDSLKLALEINKRAQACGKIQNILLQMDIAREEQKFGLSPGEIDQMLDGLSALAHVRLQGLMTMAPLCQDAERIRGVFRDCYGLFQQLAARPLPGGGQMKYLSMGMSGDYTIAIEEGANMVRIGSAVFGESSHREV
jgi:pyridoxal phosphate enzyme (YggS family)